MPNELRIALVQTDLAWKDKNANLREFEDLLLGIEGNIDIIVFPEMFNTAFCVDDLSLAENKYGDTLFWMQEMARKKNSAICGSILFEEDEHHYNRFLFVKPDGTVFHYNKHHLFSLVDEHKLLTPGKEKIVFEYKGWKIQPLICYDLRFPKWCQVTDQAELQIYVASWPTVRIQHWKTLLHARAIENQCYVVGVNRIGYDIYKHSHNGCSVAFDFSGKQLCVMDNVRQVEIVKVSKSELEKYRERYPFWKDRDTFGE